MGRTMGRNRRPRCHLRRLAYLNNRYYDPTVGVFTSVDPLVGRTGTPYLYANGNPSTFSDPSGLCWVNNGRQARDDGSGICAVDQFTGNFESAIDQALDPVPTAPVDRFIWQMEHQGANGDYSGVAPAGFLKGFIGSAIGAVKGAACTADPVCASRALITAAQNPGAVIEGAVHWDKCGSGKVSECVGSFAFDFTALFASLSKGRAANTVDDLTGGVRRPPGVGDDFVSEAAYNGKGTVWRPQGTRRERWNRPRHGAD